MTVPDFQSMMLPLLQFAGDDQEHTMPEARNAVAEAFSLSEDDRRERLPSGSQRTLDNRVAWAVIYMRRAGLLDRTGRGRFEITERGKRVLKSPPSKINIAFLKQCPGFAEFYNPGVGEPAPTKENGSGTVAETPEDVLDSTYLSWRKAFAAELLERVKSCSPEFFEQLVVRQASILG